MLTAREVQLCQVAHPMGKGVSQHDPHAQRNPSVTCVRLWRRALASARGEHDHKSLAPHPYAYT